MAQPRIFEPKATELGTESKASESETQEPTTNRSEEPTEEASSSIPKPSLPSLPSIRLSRSLFGWIESLTRHVQVSQVEVVEEEEDSHAKVNKIEEAPELEDVSSCGFLTVCWSGQPRSGEA